VKEQLVYLGIDIAKSYLDGAIENEKRRFSNDAIGHRQLIQWIKQIPAKVQVICEPSGGYERALVRAVVGAQLKISLVPANRVRQFARARYFWLRPIALTRSCCALLEKRCSQAQSVPLSWSRNIYATGESTPPFNTSAGDGTESRGATERCLRVQVEPPSDHPDQKADRATRSAH